MVLEFRVMPRISEISGSHVSNTVLPVWCEEARVPLLGPVAERTGPNAQFGIVRRAEYDYLRELFYGAEVEVVTVVESIGTTSATLYQELWQHTQKAATARTVLVQVDIVTKAKLPFSDASRTFLEHYRNVR